MNLSSGKQSINRAEVGDIVCLFWVKFGQDDPWSQFELPALFRVEEKAENGYGYKFVHIASGRTIEEHRQTFGIMSYMYRPEDVFFELEYRENIEQRRLNSEITKLKNERDILRKILVEQGVRVITEDQAKALGITK